MRSQLLKLLIVHANRKLARETAQKSIVMLKNNGILAIEEQPLKVLSLQALTHPMLKCCLATIME